MPPSFREDDESIRSNKQFGALLLMSCLSVVVVGFVGFFGVFVVRVRRRWLGHVGLGCFNGISAVAVVHIIR